MYTAALNSQTVTADATQDLWSILAGASTQIIVYGWEVTSDAVAATLMECTLLRISASGTGGAVPAGFSIDDRQTAATTAVVHARDVNPGTPIGSEILAGYQWEQLGPLGQIYIPEMRIVCQASEGIALVANTSDAFEMSGFVVWEELG